jgi:enoyl-CoA hydratase/carnithine racemase
MSFRERVASLGGSPGAVSLTWQDAGTGRIGLLRIDHPGARNALSPQMMVQFSDAVAALDAACSVGTQVRAVVVGGIGPWFCAGGDLAAVQEHLLVEGAALEMQAFMRAACDALAGLPVPVIAAVEGPALGGGAELLTACDLVFAAADAKIGFVQAAMGVSPGFGGGARLVRRHGARGALDLLSRARPLDAQQAHVLGVVDEVVEVAPGAAWERALARAYEVASLPPVAARAIKPLVNRLVASGAEGAVGTDCVDVEAQVFASLWGGAEHVAAIQRFRRR